MGIDDLTQVQEKGEQNEGSANGADVIGDGHDEADLKANRISFGSPVAKALIGKREGDEVDVTTPKGIKEYEILKVQYI